MGLTVLYIAFGVVALWLLGEVLLQYKARLRWRLLAFGGFLTVVLGVLVASRVVIGLGAIAFAVGQTYVTLSFRKGFSTGWAIGGRPGASRRRKDGVKEPRPAAPEPVAVGETGAQQAYDGFDGPEVQGSPEHGFPAPDPTAGPDHGFPATPDVGVLAGAGAPGVPGSVYEPQPMPDETGQYGVYSDTAYMPTVQQQDGGLPDGNPDGGAYDGGYAPYYGDGTAPAEAPGGYDFGQDQQQYPAYSDPYVGGAQQYTPYEGGYDSFGNPQPYGSQDPAGYYPQDGVTDTPPGGVWVPQQRDDEPARQPGPGDEQPPYDYGPGQGGQGYDNEQQQYRY
ncbi:hypothetical protein [Streptomyces qinzhouensis]|uniref:Uncharacterized protein n=1 Tax=Streptomyces qinzhouensis TaxID=2599401 RepID=A0A5B8JFW6_9ACTN|nr:hypothetical protein [Streptomyces qinzhouensis]QDY76343.1 hypothetical protein FQU76_07110 [Streptomyces qinzhouensis]